MSQNVLTSFLVGIGWETSDFDRGTRDFDRSMQGVKTSTLAVSAAILGVFAGVASAAVGTAHRVDQLSLATQNLNTSKQFVSNLGGALKLMGGDAGAALSEVQSIEETLANFRLKGELGAIGQLPFASVQIDDLAHSNSASEFLSKLADQVPNLNNQQKQVVQKSLGLSDATMKAISGGGQQFEALLQRSQDLTGTITQLTDNSRALSDQMAEFGLRMTGITNELTEKTLPGLVKFSTWTNQFIEKHRDDISGVIDTVAEQPGATAALGGGAAATAFGALLSKLGLSTIGGAASKAGTAGMIVGGATLATDVVFDTLETHFPALKETEQSVDKAARNMGLGKLVDFSDWLFNTESDESKQSPSWLEKQQLPGTSILSPPVNNGSSNTNEGMAPTTDLTSPPPSYTPVPLPDSADYTPTAMPTPYKDVTRTQEDNDALVKAIQTAKVNVSNDLNVNVSLDGQALDAKITAVTRRDNYSTIDDVRSTTAR